MSDAIIQNLTCSAVVGLVVWVWTLWRDYQAFKLKVAEEYLKTSALKEVKDEIHQLRNLMGQIALKLDIPIFTEPYTR